MNAANISDEDIIEIDAGGKIIKTRRSTLTLVPNSLFASMFSGRWALELDNNSRIFLDEDPEFIESIINFLRNKKREDPSKPIQSTPKVREEKKEDFISLLDYYGLTDFFYPPSVFDPLDINNMEVVQPDCCVDVTRSKNKIQCLYNRDYGGDYIVACKPTLDSSEEGSFWKVTIGELPANNQSLYLGIIGNLAASHDVFDWSGFTQGDCLYFHLTSNKLTMFCVQENKKCTMNVATSDDAAYYIHFKMQSVGTKWTLEPLSEEERARFL